MGRAGEMSLRLKHWECVPELLPRAPAAVQYRPLAENEGEGEAGLAHRRRKCLCRSDDSDGARMPACATERVAHSTEKKRERTKKSASIPSGPRHTKKERQIRPPPSSCRTREQSSAFRGPRHHGRILTASARTREGAPLAHRAQFQADCTDKAEDEKRASAPRYSKRCRRHQAE